MKKYKRLDFINTELKSDSESDSEPDSEAESNLMAILKSGSDSG